MLVVNFCRQWQSFTDKFSIKFVFSNTSRWLLLKLPRNNQSILTRSQVAEHHCISYRMFSNFSCVLLLPSVLTFSVLFSPHFCRDEVKFYSISVKRVMLILLGLIFPGIERGISVIHKISAVWKNRLYHKCLTAVIVAANIHCFEFLAFDIILVSKLMYDF